MPGSSFFLKIQRIDIKDKVGGVVRRPSLPFTVGGQRLHHFLGLQMIPGSRELNPVRPDGSGLHITSPMAGNVQDGDGIRGCIIYSLIG